MYLGGLQMKPKMLLTKITSVESGVGSSACTSPSFTLTYCVISVLSGIFSSSLLSSSNWL